MTRDRPASGGQDSTLDGEFPGDFGGGASRVEPQKIAEPFGQRLNSSGFQVPDQDYNQYTIGYVAPSPILRINDSPIGGTLSGVYQFNTPYMLNYTNTRAEINNETYTSATTISLTNTATLSDQHPGMIGIQLDIEPTGTGTIYENFTLQWSLNGLSATHFSTYALPYGKIYPSASIESGQGFHQLLHDRVQPAYSLNFIRSNLNTANFGVVPNSNTTLTLSATFNADSVGTSIDVRRFWAVIYGLTGINTGYITNTLQSSL